MSNRLNIPQLNSEIPRLGNRFSQFLGMTVLRLMGWRFEGNFPAHKKMVLAVAPHTSNWDFVIGLAVAFSLKLKISFFGKHSIFIPPFDRLLRRWGGIPIERSKAHGVVTQITNKINSTDKMILCLSPEGTRSRIEKWKTGFLHIAHKADVPVFLVAFDYQKKKIIFGPDKKISADIDSELLNVYSFYANVQAKFPDKVSCPLERQID